MANKNYVMSKSLEFLRHRGEIPTISEHYVMRNWVPKGSTKNIAGYKEGLVWVADIVSIGGEGRGTCYYQITTGSNVSARIKKMLELTADKFNKSFDTYIGLVESAVRYGNGVFVHGWSKKGNRWRLREIQFTIKGMECFMYRDQVYYKKQNYLIDNGSLYGWEGKIR